jgi:hypothetical protein
MYVKTKRHMGQKYNLEDKNVGGVLLLDIKINFNAI